MDLESKSSSQRIKELETEILSLQALPWDLIGWRIALLNYELMTLKFKPRGEMTETHQQRDRSHE